MHNTFTFSFYSVKSCKHTLLRTSSKLYINNTVTPYSKLHRNLEGNSVLVLISAKYYHILLLLNSTNGINILKPDKFSSFVHCYCKPREQNRIGNKQGRMKSMDKPDQHK